MFSSREFWRACVQVSVLSVCMQVGAWAQTSMATAHDRYPGAGRDATPSEVAAWDIDVRPDFKGLPAGKGSVAQGQDVWETKCAHCHGIFGESNEVFSPLVGGTSAEDVKTGHVAYLSRTDYPGRTTVMKVATVSTLWDYIRRAMPWNNPKSLSVDEVYAVTAFLLNLGHVVPDDFTLSDRNMAEVQQRMPNRNGMTRQHALWPGTTWTGAAKPDVRNTPCMSNCRTEPRVASLLPDFARNAHGNLREQNRIVGPQRGADTTQPEGRSKPAAGSTGNAAGSPVSAASSAAASKPAAETAAGKAALALTQKYQCTACHAMDKKLVGPSFADVARRHADKADYLAGKIRSGGAGVWGPIPMPPQTLPDADARHIATWLASGATR
jgi:cytochrome c551/c552/cytochrome c553